MSDQPRPAYEATTPQLPPNEAATVPPVAGAVAAFPVLPGYEVLGELGRGGMGIVYKARQLGLNRIVALKVMLAGPHAGPDDLARFRREAEAMARLKHHNVVEVYHVVEHAGMPFFSMEFCEGGSLAQKLGGQPQPVRQAAETALTLARAVQAAHDAGVIHRDLKPANVLLGRDGEPKVTDFGLAKKLDGVVDLTRTGAIMGTPSYMAPEQAQGDGKHVGPQADVYALGVILYEMLTGAPPFRSSTPFDTLMQVLSDPPQPPSRLRDGVPSELEAVCLRCLQKKAGHRYPTAGELAEDLRRFLDGLPLSVRPSGAVPAKAGWRLSGTLERIFNVAGCVWIPGLALMIFLLFRMDRYSPKWLTATVSTNWAFHEKGPWFALVWGREAVLLEEPTGRRADSWQLSDPGTAVAFSAAGDLLAVGKANGEVVLFSTASGQRVSRFLAHGGPVRLIRFTDEDKTLVTATGPGEDVAEVKRWDRATNGPLPSSPLRGRGVVRPDGLAVVVRQGDRLRLADVATGKDLAIISLREEAVAALKFSPDGGLLAVVGKEVSLFDGHTGQPRGTVESKGRDLVFSADGSMLATAEPDGVAVWETATGRRRSIHDGPGFAPTAFTSDPPTLAVFATRPRPGREFPIGVTRLVDPATGRSRREIDEYKFVALRPDGRLYLSTHSGRHAHDYGTLCLTSESGLFWEKVVWGVVYLSGGAAAVAFGMLIVLLLPSILLSKAGKALQLAFSDDGTRLASALRKQVRVWDVIGERLLLETRTLKPVRAVGFAPDGRTCATLSPDGIGIVWDATTGEERSRFLLPFPNIGLAVFSPDLRLVAVRESGFLPWLRRFSSDFTEPFSVWDIAAQPPRQLASLPSKWPIQQVLFSRDGEVLAAKYRRCAQVWRLEGAGGPPRELLCVQAEGDVIALSGDGKTLAMKLYKGQVGAFWIGKIVIWDTRTGQQVGALKKVNNPMEALLLSPDGRILIGPDRSNVEMWDLATGELVAKVPTELDALHSLALSPDGRTLAFGDAWGGVAWIDVGLALLQGRRARERDGSTANTEASLRLHHGDFGSTT